MIGISNANNAKTVNVIFEEKEVGYTTSQSWHIVKEYQLPSAGLYLIYFKCSWSLSQVTGVSIGTNPSYVNYSLAKYVLTGEDVRYYPVLHAFVNTNSPYWLYFWAKEKDANVNNIYDIEIIKID